MKNAPLRAVGFMLLGASSFAAMNAIARSLRELPWPTLAFARAFLGLLAALALARWRGASLRVADRRVMWQRSFFGTASMLCTFYALTHMPLADATALLNTTPLWIAALAWFTLRERVSWRVSLALAVAFVGVLLVERPGFGVGQRTGLVALAAGAFGAAAMVSLRRLSQETPEAVVVHFSAVASAVLALVSGAWLLRHGATPHVSPSQALGVVAMGATATVGQLAITRAYALDKAARVGAVGWVQVVIALAVDAVVFAHRPEAAVTAGIAALLVAGGLLVEDARREECAVSTGARGA